MKKILGITKKDSIFTKKKVMKLSEIIKALEDGRTVKADNMIYYKPEFFKKNKGACIGNILKDINNNFTFEIVEPNKVVSITGWYEPHNNGSWGENEIKDLDTHKITFEVDKDNNPICETIKMIEL